MAAQTLNATQVSIHKTLVTTTADTVTITGTRRTVKVTNRHATEWLWAKAVEPGAAALAAADDGAIPIAPGRTELVPLSTGVLGIVGSANPYSVSLF